MAPLLRFGLFHHPLFFFLILWRRSSSAARLRRATSTTSRYGVVLFLLPSIVAFTERARPIRSRVCHIWLHGSESLHAQRDSPTFVVFFELVQNHVFRSNESARSIELDVPIFVLKAVGACDLSGLDSHHQVCIAASHSLKCTRNRHRFFFCV